MGLAEGGGREGLFERMPWWRRVEAAEGGGRSGRFGDLLECACDGKGASDGERHSDCKLIMEESKKEDKNVEVLTREVVMK